MVERGGQILNDFDSVGTRYERYAGIIDAERLKGLRVMVVGVGAVGRKAALMCAEMGVGYLSLVDPDEVSVENLGVQGYRPDQIGMNKAWATSMDVDMISGREDPEQEDDGLCVVRAQNKFFDATMLEGNRPDVVLVCVDSMEARKEIVEAVFNADSEDQHPLILDARMNALAFKLYTIASPVMYDGYMAAWYGTEQAQAPLGDDADELGGCTTKSTIFCASLAAAMMVNQMCRWLRGFPCDEEQVRFWCDTYQCATKGGTSECVTRTEGQPEA